MSPATYQKDFTMRGVEPIYPDRALSKALSFMPGQTILKGTVLAQVSGANANEVQTINYSGTWAEGDTLTLSIAGIDGGTYSTTLAMDATPAFTAANVKAAIEAMLLAAGYVGATVTVVNAGATDQTVTFGGTAAAWNMPLMTAAYETAGDGTVTVDATTAGNKLGLWGPYVGAKLADPTAAPTVASLAGGTGLPLLMQGILAYTFMTAQGETLPSPGTAFALTTTDRSIRVSAITLPTGATGVRYYINGFLAATSADGTQKDITALLTTASVPCPDVNRAFTNTDGRHIARAIAEYTFRTDNTGRVVLGSSNSMPDNGAYDLTAPAWFAGEFKTSELVGLTADAIADLGRLQSGTLADGILALI